MDKISKLMMGTFVTLAMLWTGCPGKYDNAPEATAQETGAMKERYQALINEAKKIGEGQELDLLHHFSSPTLSQTKPAEFKSLASPFVALAKSGKLDSLEITGGRAPGKVRLLLITTEAGKGAIPFVKRADGWKLDDVETAFGKYEKEADIKGTAPAPSPSSLASLAVLQDPQASSYDLVQAGLELAEAKDKATADKFAATQKPGWAKTALLYAAWKSGGACEPFSKAFPIANEEQKELYDSDTDSYRTLLKGLTDCAGSSDKLGPTLKVYKGCHAVDGGARSEYVDPVVAMANAKPELVLKAALQAKLAYEQDPVANILVGALHGEQKSAFYTFLSTHAGGRGKTAKLAKEWFDKMATRDEIEPPGSEEGGTE